MLGVGLDAFGFVAEFVALRTLPLFLVQAAIASSLAVTAVLAARMIPERLGTVEWAGVAGVCLGLAMLGFSAGSEGGSDPGGWFDVAMAVAVVLLGIGAVGVARAAEPIRSIGLGLCAGLMFGVVALAARTLTQLDPVRLVREPSTYLLIVGGVFGFLLYTTALQRGSVTAATAAMVVGETAAPAGIGLFVLGDHARPGLGWLAVCGFVLAVAGALSLARFGEIQPQ
jgi:drug/metabolite transporter (DMT)-like permease